MPTRPTKIRTTPTPGTQLTLKAVNQSALTATALLTYPEIDYAGDWVQPDGGEWEPRLYVRTGVPVDQAHGAKIGFGTVEMKSVDVGGKAWNVPVGTTHFERGNRLAEQTFRLVADDIMTGVSLEFQPLVAKSMGHRSPLASRDAMRYDRWRGFGWAHDIQPINSNARTLLPEVMEKAFKATEVAISIASTGKYGGEYQHPLIVKALSRLLPTSRRTTVRVEKAMDYGTDMVADAPPADDATPTGTDTYPTAAAAFDLAQSLLDACDAAEASLENGEHVKGRDKLQKLIEQVRTYVDDCNAVGEMVESDLDGKMDDSEEAGDETPADDGDDSAPVEKALVREGVLITKSGYVPKRFKSSDFNVPTIPEHTVERKAAEATLVAAQRRLRRAAREAQPFLDAAEVN